MKRYIIQTLVTVLLVTLLIQSGCAAAPSLPQVESEQQSHTISVSGSGQVSVQPDVAVVTGTVVVTVPVAGTVSVSRTGTQ